MNQESKAKILKQVPEKGVNMETSNPFYLVLYIR